MDKIHSTLRITTILNIFFCAVDKDFNFTATYLKGHEEIFMAWMIINNPGDYLMPIMISLVGSRKYLCWDGAPSVFINFGYYVDFLMQCLCVPNNLLQKKLFLILRSVGINAVIIANAIMCIAIGLTIQFLKSKKHELGEYNWGIFSIGKLVDKLYDFCIKIQKDGL